MESTGGGGREVRRKERRKAIERCPHKGKKELSTPPVMMPT